MTRLDLQSDPHRRFNALTGSWVLVSPHRTDRPWQGQVDHTPTGSVPAYEPGCYMCPGNSRANGTVNPPYESTFVFDNDFPALRRGTSTDNIAERELIVAAGAPGRCRVVCYSPRHDLTLARMRIEGIRRVVDVWREETAAIANESGVRYVQVFENRGAMMGASNPHPHGQIWATAHLPDRVAVENAHLQRYFDARGTDLLGDYLDLERDHQVRMVCGNEHFVAIVPFWAVWPFETMIVATRRVSDLSDLSSAENDALADMLQRLLARYDNLFEAPCPYSMGFHPRPIGLPDTRHWRWHAHFYPPVLRSATIRKFMVGYEMLGTPQRDLTPEEAAARLRGLSDRHYLERND